MQRRTGSALDRLSGTARRESANAIAELERLWPRPDLLIRAARAVEPAFVREQVIGAYLRRPDGSLGELAQTLRPPYSAGGWRGAQTIPRHAAYPLDQRDRWANLPVTEDRVWAGRPEVLEAFREAVLAPNDMHWQLRVTLYDGDSFLGLFGLYRPRDGRRFDAQDHAVLAALTPALRDVFEVARTFQDTNLEHGGVVDVMDALERAAFLVTREGRVVHANAVARALHRSAPPWLRDVVRSPVPDHPLVRIRPMRVDGVPLFFVQYRGAPPVLETSTLPPSLERVRALMACGCSDKDIAAALGISLATARTYATRVLQRLELHDRRQLMVGSQRDQER